MLIILLGRLEQPRLSIRTRVPIRSCGYAQLWNPHLSTRLPEKTVYIRKRSGINPRSSRKLLFSVYFEVSDTISISAICTFIQRHVFMQHVLSKILGVYNRARATPPSPHYAFPHFLIACLSSGSGKALPYDLTTEATVQTYNQMQSPPNTTKSPRAII